MKGDERKRICLKITIIMRLEIRKCQSGQRGRVEYYKLASDNEEKKTKKMVNGGRCELGASMSI